MTSPYTNGPWGSDDYDALLKQADARTTSGFGAPPPTLSEPAAQQGPTTRASRPSAGRSRPGRSAAFALRSPTRGQGLSWISLLLVLLCSAALGLTIHSALAGVDFLSLQESLRHLSHQLNFVLLSLVGALLALLLAIVALFRARPRLVATCAVLLAIVLPFVAAAIAGKLGVDTLAVHATSAASQLGTNPVQLVNELLRYLGVDPAPLQGLLKQLFG